MSKPMLTCWMGDATVGDSRALLAEAGIPSFRTPEAAVGAFGNIAAFYQNQQLLQQTPAPLARQLVERSRVAETLAAWCGGAGAVDMDALERVLLRVSEMVCELPGLREMDINPIIVDESGAVAVDARIVVGSPAAGGSGYAASYHHLAILPYPARYQHEWPLRGGGVYNVRPVHPDDAQCCKAWCSISRRKAGISASCPIFTSFRRRCCRVLR